MTSDDDSAVLSHALDQLSALLSDVPRERLGDRTPCELWTVQDLVDHVVTSPARFARMMRGEPIDWSAPASQSGADPAGAFRVNADDLLRTSREHAGEAGPPLDWQCAELACHTWDLAAALGRPTRDLDPEVAERGLAFVRANLKEDDRSPAFGPEQPAPEGADPYQRIAAFAGRSV